MRFAFLGRVSTEDQQDPESSRAWQLNRARALVEPHGGEVVAEFFDIGQSRSIPWQRRPRASALLTALRDPNRGFEAVVIGEPHRAFYGNQFGLTFPLFVHYGVQLWVPEVGGALDPDNEAHDLVMSVFGGMSKGERNRIKVRVRTAMASQAALEGRFLGGRPPYGYRLVDLGPHPNPAKAADGRMLHGLAPDPVAAPVVVRIFAEYIRGNGLYAIAERLNRDGILSPSAHDPERNPHRSGAGWSKGAVRAILTNPRYTGVQVWNRQRKHEVLLHVNDVALGHQTRMRWNPQDAWITSNAPSHEPIITTEAFQRAQDVLAHARRISSKSRKPRPSPRPYQLRSLLFCGLCGRRMQGNMSNNRPSYRCLFRTEYAVDDRAGHPRGVYLREDHVVPSVDEWIGGIFRPDSIEATLDALADSQPPDRWEPDAEAARIVAECDAKLVTYRAALESGTNPELMNGWIDDVLTERARARAKSIAHTTKRQPRMSREQIRGRDREFVRAAFSDRCETCPQRPWWPTGRSPSPTSPSNTPVPWP
jgi:site-specific DNA recombinase